MKRKTLLLMLPLLLIGALQLPAMQDQIPVPIENIENGVPVSIPRNSNPPLVSCEYDSNLFLFSLTLENTRGTSIVLVSNLSTGELVSVFPTGEGTSYIPISGTSGLWRIYITLQDGAEYVGEILL